ncbi:DUF3829 domain-containing protein [Desulfovibrio litoralis]|uniref:DUF3829 domain-containing protein n=1 Tax=Desulfovibrio litoralis DSM 11393 TaxID=1121455 RepID=A0A1M7TCY3_9BACT|nr:DUF3829 domain-containing protein [Desulfovibrio litoralis]SHN68609.1 Protein of unknown function [Desulfovibrio litoralis DSM 11393]
MNKKNSVRTQTPALSFFRTMPKLVLLLALGSFTIGALGCSSDSEEKSGQEKTASQATQPAGGNTDKKSASQETDSNLSIEKWNAYIALTNETYNIYFKMVETYLIAFGQGEKPTEPKHNNDRIDFNNSTLNTGNLEKAIDKTLEVAAQNPDDFDRIATEAAKALKEQLPLLVKLGKYSRNKGYIDDKGALAIELHPQIIKNFPIVDASFGQLDKAIGEQEKQRQAEDLKHLKAEGMEISATALELYIAATDIQKYMSEKEVTRDNFRKVIKLEELRKLYDKLPPLMANLEKLSTNLEQVKKEGLRESDPTSFLDSAGDFKVEVASLIEVLEKSSGGASTSSLPQQIANNYNRLVNSYNRDIAH